MTMQNIESAGIHAQLKKGRLIVSGAGPEFQRQFDRDTYSDFLRRMLDDLHEYVIPDGYNAGTRPLARARIQAYDDYIVALLDSWAIVCDILTFYDERIASECYLATAVEERSVYDLVGLIGYGRSGDIVVMPGLTATAPDASVGTTTGSATRAPSSGQSVSPVKPRAATSRSTKQDQRLKKLITRAPSPGVAASTHLGLVVASLPDSPKTVTVPKGTPVLSVPKQGGAPQTFETTETVQAKASLNSITPHKSTQTVPQKITTKSTAIRIDGVKTRVSPGALIVLTPQPDATGKTEGPSVLRTIKSVSPDAKKQQTTLTLEPTNADTPDQSISNPSASTFRRKGKLFGYNAKAWDKLSDDDKQAFSYRLGGLFRVEPSGVAPSQINGGFPVSDVDKLTPLAMAVDAASGDAYAGTSGSGVYKRSSQTGEWNAVNNGLTTLQVYSMHACKGGSIYAGTSGGGVYRTDNDGQQWEQIEGGTSYTKRAPDKVLNRIPSSVVHSVTCAGCPPASGQICTVYAATDNGVFSSHDRGNGWIPVNTGLPGYSEDTGFAQVAVKSLVAVSMPGGTITWLIATNGSAIWQVLAQEATPTWQQSWLGITASKVTALVASPEGSAAPFVYAATDQGVFRSVAGSGVWTPGDLSTGEITSLAVADDGNLAAAGKSGLYLSADFGESWTKLAFDTPQSIVSVAFASDGSVLAGTPFGDWKDSEWPNFHPQGNQIDLSNANQTIVVGSLVSLTQHVDAASASGQPGVTGDTQVGIYTAKQSYDLSREDYDQRSQVTRIIVEPLTGSPPPSAFDLRNTTVLMGSDAMQPSRDPAPNQPIGLPSNPSAASDTSGNGGNAAMPTLSGGSSPQTRNSAQSAASPANAVAPAGTPPPSAGASLANASPSGTSTAGTPPTSPSLAAAVGAPPPSATTPNAAPAPDNGHANAPNAPSNMSPSDGGSQIHADGILSDLVPGQKLIVQGKRSRVTIGMLGGVFTIDKSRDGWKSARLGLSNLDVTCLNWGTVALAGTSGSGVLRSIDIGKTWHVLNDGLTSLDVRAVQTATDGATYVGTAKGVFRLAPDADGWNAINDGLTSLDVRAIAIGSGYLLVGTGGGVFRSDDGGSTWTSSSAGLANTDVRAFATGTDGMTFAATGVGVFRSGDTGRSWHSASRGIANVDVRAIAVSPQGVVYAGTDGGVFRTANAGASWLPFGTGLGSVHVRALMFDGDGTLYAGTEGGAFAISPNATKWQPVYTGASNIVQALTIAPDGRLIAAAKNAAIVTAPDDGKTLTLTMQPDFAMYTVNPSTLDQNYVSPELTQAFSTHSQPLPADATLTVLEQGRVWLVSAGDDKSYALTSMQDAISVSETPVPLTVTAAPTATAQNGTSLWQVADTLGFAGQIVAADGEMLPMAASADADTVSELATLDSAEYTPEDSRTTLKLKQPLANVYDSATVEILGNVVPANHGRTIANEVVGSGDSGKANQSFALKYPHLIYESDPDDANAITSTLSVRVLATSASSLYASVSGISNQAAGGVVWKEVPTLYTAGPRDQVFTTQTDGSGVTTLIFGDGVRGARLPTGQDNVVATYRVGVASDGGSIQSGQLTLMQRRPAGLRQVVSPLPATGAIPRESTQQARLQAPLATNTMQRIVSLDDYAAFVSGIRGVGKVDVRTYRSGSRHLVLVTVASSDGKPVASDSALGMSVIEAVQHYQAAHARVRLATFRPRRFKVAASIVIDAASAGDDPQQTIASALTDAFSFGKRAFGQGVSESEVTTVIQDCPGVISVVLTGLYPSEHTAAILPYIGARRASWDARTDTVHDAALLVIDDDINLHLIDG